MSPSGFKVAVRRLGVHLCRGLLFPLSRPFELVLEPTLILAPHQDDETLACGGLIARKRDEGHDVHVVFLTNGDASHRGHPRLSTTELVELRRREAREALTILGVDSACIHFWDEPDGSLKSLNAERRETLIARLAAFLQILKPGRVFVPCSPDASSEHDPVLGLVTAAANQARLGTEIWQYPVWSWWNPSLMFAKILQVGTAHRLAGEDFHSIKRRALECYRSQIKPVPPWDAPSLPPELMDFCLNDPEYFFRGPDPTGDSYRPII
ncbi:MAG TPA: PIG-L family deacetylase [Candidatus Didemnitutus sp.]|nr:PIG-L family deacetylase [Candidatus Didemnitutus sp.]